VPYLQTMVYAYGLIITSENITNATVSLPVALFTEATAVTNLFYYKGVLYWIRGGLIWYKPTALTAPFTAPTQAVAPALVTSFYIVWDTIFYTTTTDIRSCDLAGNSDGLIITTVATSVIMIGPIVFYRTAASEIRTLSSIVYASGIAKITADGLGSNSFYILDNASNVRRVTYDVLTLAILTDTVLASRQNDIGQPRYDSAQKVTIIPGINYDFGELLGIDSAVDYDFDYPNNLVPEIMAWQSAIDYRTKQDVASDEHKGKLAQLWDRFSATIRRDEYKPERIRNVYSTGGYTR
jgi:hypothetical protein